MSRKTMIMMGMIVGSIVGGYAVTLFGVDTISVWSLVGSTIGGFIGIYAGFKLSG
jgi:hypothetical protein